jgi:3'(2'), 5'-bisphosphate nucleotidase
MTEFTKASTPLAQLCEISRDACAILAEFVVPCYDTMNSDTSKLKADKSVFTIADGIVQHLLIEHLYVGKFLNIVGEEDDSSVNITSKPYTVDDLVVPDMFEDMIDSVRTRIEALAGRIDSEAYQTLTVFIDPIDGTREFATAKGEQCSICIGFADNTGIPVAGIVFRPITTPFTFAAGAASEGYFDSVLNEDGPLNPQGLLTSNGSISPFIGHLIEELGYTRVPSGGAGNKMLMLLEGKGGCYIQDRGVSRW